MAFPGKEPECLLLWGRRAAAGESMGNRADSKHAWPIAHVHREFLKRPPRAWEDAGGSGLGGKQQQKCRSHGNLPLGSGAVELLLPSMGGEQGEAQQGEPGDAALGTHAGSWVRSGLGRTGHSVFPGSWVCTRTSPPGGPSDRRCLRSHPRSSRSLDGDTQQATPHTAVSRALRALKDRAGVAMRGN